MFLVFFLIEINLKEWLIDIEKKVIELQRKGGFGEMLDIRPTLATSSDGKKRTFLTINSSNK